MRPPDLLSRGLFNLIPILAALAFVIGLCWAAILVLRKTGLSKPRPRAHGVKPVSPLGSVLVIAWAIGLGVVVVRAQGHWTGFGGLADVYVYVIAALGPLVVLVFAEQAARVDRVYARVSRRAERGDIAGAISELQAALDRTVARSGPPAGVATGPADPWAPPHAAIHRDERLVIRLNLMATLHGEQGDWATALDWLRRAEEVGGPRPVFRLNIGRARAQLGAEAEGIAAMRAAVAEVADDAPIQRFYFALVLASGLAEAGQWAESCNPARRRRDRS